LFAGVAVDVVVHGVGGLYLVQHDFVARDFLAELLERVVGVAGFIGAVVRGHAGWGVVHQGYMVFAHGLLLSLPSAVSF